MVRARRKTGRKEVRAPGRPREFDPEKALDRALRVFWEHGYEGASLTELTAAMGINRPSLYATFGNKEELFRKVLDRYAQDAAGYMREGLREPTARGAVEKMLFASADELSATGHPRGCLLVQGALACGNESEAVKRELSSRRAAGEVAIRERLERAKAEGDLPAEADAAELASFVMTVLHGMSVQAAGGAKREKLRRIAGHAMAAWPGPG
jgi:AcrR family transcriptional regulator